MTIKKLYYLLKLTSLHDGSSFTSQNWSSLFIYFIQDQNPRDDYLSVCTK